MDVSSQKLDSANLDVFYSPQIGCDGKATLSSLFLISVEDIVSCARGDKDFSCGRRAWLGDTLFHLRIQNPVSGTPVRQQRRADSG